MDEGIFSWDHENGMYVDVIIKELESYGICTKKHDSGNVLVWLPGGEEIEFIHMKAYGAGNVTPRFTYPNGRTKFGEQVMDFPQLLPVTMVLCKLFSYCGFGMADDYILRMAVFKETMVDKARKCLNESGDVALKVKYNMTPEELDFIDSFKL